jgi:hypothetical protein
MAAKTIIFSDHAMTVLRERGLDRSWVERTIRSPVRQDRDPRDTGLMRAYAAVPERDGRIMRVVYKEMDRTILVVTTFLDRGARADETRI